MKPRILISFGNYADAYLKEKAGYILNCMTDNPNFAAPVPPLQALKNAIDAYSAALEAAAGLDRVKVAEKNQARTVLEQLLTQLGMYVMYVANGDAFVLTSSGFSMAKTPEPGKLANPGNVTLSNGVTGGQMVSSVKSTKYAKVYSHEITDQFSDESTNWTATHTTTCRFVFNGLVPGKQYWVRVAAIGTANQVTYSPVATLFVQ
jgi:hypothetical protein